MASPEKMSFPTKIKPGLLGNYGVHHRFALEKLAIVYSSETVPSAVSIMSSADGTAQKTTFLSGVSTIGDHGFCGFLLQLGW